MNGETSRSVLAAIEANSPSSHDRKLKLVGASDSAQSGVGASRLSHSLSDEEREKAIVRAGCLVEFFMAEAKACMARYDAEGCFSDKGAADAAVANGQAAFGLMKKLIAGRSSEQIRRMEVERGLA